MDKYTPQVIALSYGKEYFTDRVRHAILRNPHLLLLSSSFLILILRGDVLVLVFVSLLTQLSLIVIVACIRGIPGSEIQVLRLAAIQFATGVVEATASTIEILFGEFARSSRRR